MPNLPSFHVSDADADAITRIVDRAITLLNSTRSEALKRRATRSGEKLALRMDITACHANGCPLRLHQLAAADDFNFAHDVFGISRHLNRDTGQLQDCFLPRFAARTEEAA